MRSTITTLVALLSIVPLVSLSAQTERPVLVGTRVRITMPDTMRTGQRPNSARPLLLTGQLVAMSDSTMSVRNDVTASDVTVPLSRVQRLEVSTGSNRQTRAMLGGLIGLGVGGMIGFASGDDCSDREGICFPQDETAFVGALLGGAIGSLVGFVVGQRDSWKEAAVPARVSFVPTGTRSLSITSTLRF